jgi:hypothetical protein
MGNTQSDSSSIIHQGMVVKKCKEIAGIPFECERRQAQVRLEQ